MKKADRYEVTVDGRKARVLGWTFDAETIHHRDNKGGAWTSPGQTVRLILDNETLIVGAFAESWDKRPVTIKRVAGFPDLARVTYEGGAVKDGVPVASRAHTDEERNRIEGGESGRLVAEVRCYREEVRPFVKTPGERDEDDNFVVMVNRTPGKDLSAKLLAVAADAVRRVERNAWNEAGRYLTPKMAGLIRKKLNMRGADKAKIIRTYASEGLRMRWNRLHKDG